MLLGSAYVPADKQSRVMMVEDGDSILTVGSDKSNIGVMGGQFLDRLDLRWGDFLCIDVSPNQYWFS